MLPTHRKQLLLALLAAPLTGCSVWKSAYQYSVVEPRLFCICRDDEASLATYRSWADQAWAEIGACCPPDCLEGDYAWGFREGFAQFVYAGGDGEPPAVPPRPYWQVDLRTREGAAAVQSWFAGYRHGAQVARDRGLRDATTLTLSASLKDCDACGCPDEPGGSCPCEGTAPGLVLPTQVAPAQVAPARVAPSPAIPKGPEFVPAPTESQTPPQETLRELQPPQELSLPPNPLEEQAWAPTPSEEPIEPTASVTPVAPAGKPPEEYARSAIFSISR